MKRNIKFRVWDMENKCWADIRHFLIEQCCLPRMDGYFSIDDILQHDLKLKKTKSVMIEKMLGSFGPDSFALTIFVLLA